MSILVAHFSAEGTTERVAKDLAVKKGADISFWIGLKSRIFI